MAIRPEDFDLKTLKKLVELKEKNGPLLDLERKRRRIRRKLSEVEEQIEDYFRQNPGTRHLLRVIEENHQNTAPAVLAPDRRARRPRGWVGQQVAAVFRTHRGPLAPSEIRDIIAGRHPEMASKNLYLSIFQHLRRHEEFRQTSDGWVMRKS